MSQTNTPADYLPEEIIRAREEADTEVMATPVERAIRNIPAAFMTPAVAVRIIECLGANLGRSPYASSEHVERAIQHLDDASCNLTDEQ